MENKKVGMKSTISYSDCSKFFIISTEFDKNISDWSYDCTDEKNGFDLFIRLVK